MGWGCHTSLGQSAFGHWSIKEKLLHINILELTAIKLALVHFCRDLHDKTIHIVTDNVSSMYYINKIGGTGSISMCRLAIELWNFSVERNLILTASYIPGKQNTLADKFSRSKMGKHEYSLNAEVFMLLKAELKFPLTLDLFASRHNALLEKYVSQNDDPFACKVDAFCIKWSSGAYIFPPIPLIARTIDKFVRDSVENGLLITPNWPGIPKIKDLCDLLICDPIDLPAHSLEGEVPTRHRFSLVAWSISCNLQRQLSYQEIRHKRCSLALQRAPFDHINRPGGSLQSGLRKIGIFMYPFP